MADGGYDPDETGTLDPNNDDDTTPLTTHKDEGGIEMKRRIPGFKHLPPRTSTSTSRQKGESSFIESTPSGKIHTSMREQQMEEIERRVKDKLPDVDMSKFKSKMDEFGQIHIKLFASNSKDYLLIDMNDDLVNLRKIRKGSQTLNAALGMTVKEKADKKIAEETAVKEKAEGKIKELAE